LAATAVGALGDAQETLNKLICLHPTNANGFNQLGR
jgi:hypothetical protein